MTQSVTPTDLIKNLTELPEKLRCSSCRTKKSSIWYQCGKSGCELVYCDKQRCYDTAAKDHHDNLDEEEMEIPHKFIRTAIRMQLHLSEESVNTNVKKLQETEKKLKNMSLSERGRFSKNVLATTGMVVGQGLSLASKIPVTELTGPVAKFLVKTSNSISGGMCGTLTAVGAGIDLAITSYRFFSGDIKDWGEYGKELLQKSIKHATTFGTVYGCTKLFLSAGVAFGGPIGALVGGVIGLGIGYFMDKGFDKYWPRNDEKNHNSQKIVIEALKRFGFRPDDIHNPNIFSKITIQKKYRAYAKECHPDSIMGKQIPDAKERFIELNAHVGVLLGIAERLYGENRNRKDTKVFKKQLSIMCSNF